jgi:geranylgeranyl pyrophosphate synthase
MPAACALEMLHTYSLIHDDLPCMDDDDFRRGKPTLHKAHGEDVAVLAGDALQAMAFELLAETGRHQVTAEVARAVGPVGMVGGQHLDLDAEGRKIDVDALRDLHQRKTGALIRVSVRAGALLAGARPSALEALSQYGEQLGLAFQIADDLLDITGNAEAMGKTPGSDEAHEKSTYPALLGVEATQKLARDTIALAVAALDDFGDEAASFRALAQYVVDRDR